jgi:hypothetical protein
VLCCCVVCEKYDLKNAASKKRSSNNFHIITHCIFQSISHKKQFRFGYRPAVKSNMCDFSPGLALEKKRISYAEKRLGESNHGNFKKLTENELFAKCDPKNPRQVSLRANKSVQEYCHDLFDLPEQLGGKIVKDVSIVRQNKNDILYP